MAKTEYQRDIEEDDIVLDADEGDPIDFWEKKQKELLTSVVDYNLGALNELVTDEVIDLSPSYQRRFRWDDARQSKLIESFLMNVPVPPVFLNEDEYGAFSVIDGKQRLTAISEFFRGRLSLRGLRVFSDVNGCTVDDLPRQLKSILKTRPTIRAIIILRQSDPDVKFEVFERLNTGGVRLNPQEIRNSAFPGPLNDRILSLSVNTDFHSLLGIKNKKKSAVYQEMRDAEFVLRFFAFRNSWREFSGGMKRHMDHFMLENHLKKHGDFDDAETDFLATLKTVSSAFGSHSFQRWQPERSQWRKQVLASLFDAQMFACREFIGRKQLSSCSEILEEFKGLFQEEEFRRSIDAATNTPTYFRKRIERTVEFLTPHFQ